MVLEEFLGFRGMHIRLEKEPIDFQGHDRHFEDHWFLINPINKQRLN